LHEAAPPPAPPSLPAASPELLQRLRASALGGDRYARHILYTWTTREQAASIRTHRRIINRRSTAARFALFDMRLKALGEDPIAALLRGDALRWRRFAWVSPWATSLGWGSRYGDELLGIELAVDAIVGRLDSLAPEPWSFVDVAGARIPMKEVLAHPERLAAVHHLWRGTDEAHTSTLEDAFREYVLCNESMIARWEIATPALRDRLSADAETMRLLAAYFTEVEAAAPASLRGWNQHVARNVWAHTPSRDDAIMLFEACLAFPIETYVPTAATAQTVAKALEDAIRAQGKPLEHRPRVRFGDKPVNAQRDEPSLRFCDGSMVIDNCIGL
jgi:hypothetical protein